MLLVFLYSKVVKKKHLHLKDKSNNMKKTPIPQAIGDPGTVVNLYTLEKLRQQQYTVMASNHLNYKVLLKEAHENDITVLSLAPFCNKWYKYDISPHSGKQRHIMQLKNDAIDMLQNAKKSRINLYTKLIPDRKNVYKRSVVHYQRLNSMINQMKCILIVEWNKTNSPELKARRELDVCSTPLTYKVISGEWGSKTGWHAELIWTSPSGHAFAITV